jgi:hypothetical protein
VAIWASALASIAMAWAAIRLAICAVVSVLA